jgi:periplasmic divalent cation tolerance protein
MGGGYVQVQVSVPSREEGLRIVRSVIEARLAACAQVVGPITSTYRWKGSINVDEEYLLLMKTSADRYDDLEAHVHQRHSYSVAEIISTPINGGLGAYLAWVDEETATPAG